MSGELGYTPESNDLMFTDTVDGETVTQIYNLGDMAWIITASALVWLMIPGLGLFYSGLLRRKNALSMIFLSLLGIAVISFQFWFWGFSLAFSDTGGPFIGNLDYFALKGVFSQASGTVPYLLFMIFQNMFACITGVIAIGGFAERSTIGPIMVFLFAWMTIVYCPIACWEWNANGWLAQLGALDFAGGTPVHISSGTAALAIAVYLGKRRGYGTERLAYKPHNTAFIIIGTAFLWVGWFGFNGGSGLGANLRAVQAVIVTNLAASVGGITWMMLDWRLERKFSAVGFCSGAISGLVGITPASGYVGAYSAVIIGFVSGIACNFATKLKYLINVDETLDVFATHGIGGLVGGILTGLLAEARVASFDGSDPIDGGWWDRHWVQLGYQLAEAIAGMAWSFVITTAILWIMHFIPGLRLRCTEEAEIVGVDDFYMGEFVADFVSADPEMRMQRIDSKLHPVSGDVVEASTPSGSSDGARPEYVKHEPNSAHAGGGRVDQ